MPFKMLGNYVGYWVMSSPKKLTRHEQPRKARILVQAEAVPSTTEVSLTPSTRDQRIPTLFILHTA